MKNIVLSIIFALAALGCAVGVCRTTCPGVWMACGAGVVLFGLLSYAFAEFAAEGRGE